MNTWKSVGMMIAALALLAGVGCGDDNSGNGGVSISIADKSVAVNNEVTLEVTVSNTSDKEFDLDAPDAAGCDKKDGDVVCEPTAAGVYDIKVTAHADPSKSATAKLTVTAGGGEGETSTYWEDDYRRFSLNGKVKTVVEREGDDTCYRKLSFDENGNLIDDARYCDDGEIGYDDDIRDLGTKFTYDAQGRLTKVEYDDGVAENREVAVIGYETDKCRHNVYLPTNINGVEEDFRLQKGFTSITYTMGSEDVLIAECVSATADELVFEGKLSGLDTTYNIDVQNGYPSRIELEVRSDGEELTMTIAEVEYGEDGIPTTLHDYEGHLISLFDNNIAEYIVKGGFLAMTKRYVLDDDKTEPSDAHTYYEYTYNDEGYLASEKEYDGSDNSKPLSRSYIYDYEYDENGNWVQQRKGYDGSFDTYNLVYRSYEYYPEEAE